jgi:uncharacterized membrane protein YkoI
MKTRPITVALLTALALGGAACAADSKDGGSKDKHLTKHDLPAPVAASIDQKFPGATIRSVEKETENGQQIYDVELTHSGRHSEMDIQTDGTVAETESQIDAANLPAPVTQAIQQKYPNSTIKDAMEKRLRDEQQLHEYEVVISTGGKKSSELTLTPDGKITEEPAEAGEEKK